MGDKGCRRNWLEAIGEWGQSWSGREMSGHTWSDSNNINNGSSNSTSNSIWMRWLSLVIINLSQRHSGQFSISRA
jgi:hypothetical protein